MAKLIYYAISSLDGYIEDADGKFDWAEPDEEVHAFVNDLVRPAGTHLFGRRMYETLVFWERRPGHPAAGRAGLRRDLAEGREDRLLEDAADSIERQDAGRCTSTTAPARRHRERALRASEQFVLSPEDERLRLMLE